MNSSEIIIYGIIALNVIFSYQGFNNASLVDKYLYNQGRIQFHKEYYRIFSSGFLHAKVEMLQPFEVFAAATFLGNQLPPWYLESSGLHPGTWNPGWIWVLGLEV